MRYEDLKIKEYVNWTLFLNEYQCYLGRVALVANRQDALDFMEMTVDETEEFFQAGREIKTALHALFNPDLMNYASLGNVFRHLHIHFIPRYQSARVFQGIEFMDKRWGQNYEPYDRNFKLSLEKLTKLKLEIQRAIV